jgi:hypothetical protein
MAVDPFQYALDNCLLSVAINLQAYGLYEYVQNELHQ